MIHLTDHFALHEFTDSQIAVRHGIDNTPPSDILPHLIVLAQALEKVRSLLERPVFVSSGYRCEALERVLCEKDFLAWAKRHGKDAIDTAWREYFRQKAHPQGWAADIVCPAFGPPYALVELIRRSGIAFDQLIEEGVTAKGGGWCHISVDPRPPGGMRGMVLVATFDASGTPHYQTA